MKDDAKVLLGAAGRPEGPFSALGNGCEQHGSGFRLSHLKWEVPLGHLGPSGRWEAICMLSSGTRSRLGRCTCELAEDRWHLKPWVTQGRGV